MLVVQGTNSVLYSKGHPEIKLVDVYKNKCTIRGKQDTFITSGMCRNSLWYYNNEVINLISKPSQGTHTHRSILVLLCHLTALPFMTD